MESLIPTSCLLGFTNILSPTHMLVIGVVALLLFGHRLPEVARSLGRAINEFKRGLRDVQDEFQAGANEEPASTPQKLSAPREVSDTAISEERAAKTPAESLKPTSETRTD